MKHLKLLQNDLSFDNYKISNDYKVPNVVKTKNDNQIHYQNIIHYDYVDLGLPSGTLWATKNIGAETETDFGLYFAWGETKGYYYPSEEKSFTWNDYKFSINGSDSNFSKYNHQSPEYLEHIDNAVKIYMGNEWDIPSWTNMHEVNDNCTSQYVSNYKNSGVNGLLFTSTINSKTLFFPFACAITNNIIENKTANPFTMIWYNGFYHERAACMYVDHWQNNLRLMDGQSRERYYGASYRAIKVNN